MPSSPKPAFGQVWSWMNLPMMLVARGPDDGDWVALSIYGPGERIEIQEGYWRGLTDDPKDRLPEWKLLSEEDK